ncbi:MAG: HDOD domain-containing protein [Pseudomonas sp.]
MTVTATLPDLLEKQLQRQAIAYQLRPLHDAGPAHQQVSVCLLSDDDGVLLTLIPSDHLLDLSRLEQLTQRQLQPVRDKQLQQILDHYQLSYLPGLPALVDAPCMIEQRLLSEPRVWVPSGLPGWCLELDSKALAELAASATASAFAVPLSNIRCSAEDPEQDQQDINTAVKNFTALRMRQRLEETIEIPPLPSTAQRIMTLRVNPDATVEQLTDVVETDPSLAAQVVSWASSSFYAAPGRIRSVEDAIVRVLGFDLVMNLSIGLSLGKTFSLPQDAPERTTPYWEQAIYTAAVIEGLGKIMPRDLRPELGLNYLAGLLHNFGYLLLAYIFPPYFKLICRHMEANPHVPGWLLDQHLLAVNRDQIGSWLMRYWDMPAEISTAIRFQHDADYQGEHHVYANLVYLSLALLSQRELGSGPAMPIPDALLNRLGLTRDDAEKSMDKVSDAQDALRKLVNDYQLGFKR